MKSRIPHNLLLLALLSSGCATTSARNSQAAADLEQQAMAYQEDGDFESAIASDRSVAAMSEHHVRSVAYQQKILYATEPLSDGWRSVDEMRRARVRRYCTARFWRPWMFRFGAMVPHPSFYCRRELFDRLGWYDYEAKYISDATRYDFLPDGD